jgi:hypothetical protein
VTLLAAPDAETRALEHGAAQVDGPPTVARLREALDELDARLRADRAAGRRAEAIFVYTGHGDVDHGEGYVQLADGRLRRSALYREVLPRLPADRVHVVVDACKSYFLAFARGAAGARQPRAEPFVDARGADLFPNVGFALSTSSGADSHEWEEYGGGIFSHEVRSALRGAGDVDRDGVVSYAELAAFVRRANSAVPNPRFRPAFTVVPPRAAKEGLGSAFLALGDGAAQRVVLLDVPLGHTMVEDEEGRRLVDLHPAAPGTRLRLPRAALYLRQGDPFEYRIPAGADEVALSTLEPRPAQLARRGALQESFRALFAAPFAAADVAAELSHPAGALAAAAPDPTARALVTVRWAALGAAAGALAAGLGCTLGAYAAAQGPPGRPQSDLTAANQRIDRLNGAAIGLYTVAAASALTSLLVTIVPRWTSRRVQLGGGPGAAPAGVSLGVALP